MAVHCWERTHRVHTVFTWTNVAVGSYSLTARATDNNGAVTTSSVVAVTVNPNTPVQLQVTYRTIVEWGTGFQGEVRVTNNSSVAASNWTVTFNCPHNLTPIWDAVIASHVGNQYVINGTPGGTSTIPANSSVVFGFIGNIAQGTIFHTTIRIYSDGRKWCKTTYI